ncbi:uncharacterized protein LOC116256577 [Nymphaea colorata]|uniref:uncharacterized protein LOC116256577 n=1 Tax=Nymphaea colorata TaxID=210225 RepID=UPI00129D704E|nr:uncharacterized protein LOC116256577 [Nymphaea colorata]
MNRKKDRTQGWRTSTSSKYHDGWRQSSGGGGEHGERTTTGGRAAAVVESTASGRWLEAGTRAKKRVMRKPSRRFAGCGKCTQQSEVCCGCRSVEPANKETPGCFAGQFAGREPHRKLETVWVLRAKTISRFVACAVAVGGERSAEAGVEGRRELLACCGRRKRWRLLFLPFARTEKGSCCGRRKRWRSSFPLFLPLARDQCPNGHFLVWVETYSRKYFSENPSYNFFFPRTYFKKLNFAPVSFSRSQLIHLSLSRLGGRRSLLFSPRLSISVVSLFLVPLFSLPFVSLFPVSLFLFARNSSLASLVSLCLQTKKLVKEPDDQTPSSGAVVTG